MRRSNYLFTSESVSEGHPDKVCDRISDEVVDLFFREAETRVSTLAGAGRLRDAGHHQPRRHRRRGARPRHRSPRDHHRASARMAIKDIGYEQDGFHWKTADVEVLLHAQSADIAQGVDAAGNKDEGAGDQGIMFGYACNETPELMPAPIHYAHKILEDAGQGAASPGERRRLLGPDAKSQVTVRYENGKPVGVDADRALDPAPRRDADLRRRARDRRALYPQGAAGGLDLARTPSGTSIRPASSSSAAPTAIAASPAARSSSTPTAAPPRMAAAPSPARTRPRSTARPPMRRAISPRTSSRRASPTAAPSSSPTRSASPSRCRSMSTCTAPARSTRPSSRRSLMRS